MDQELGMSGYLRKEDKVAVDEQRDAINALKTLGFRVDGEKICHPHFTITKGMFPAPFTFDLNEKRDQVMWTILMQAYQAGIHRGKTDRSREILSLLGGRER